MRSADVASIFTLASFTNFSSPLLLGILLDYCGPRTCSLVSNLLVCLGFLLFSVSSGYYGFLAGVLLIAFGGPGVQNSVIHIGNMYPDIASLVTSFITGAFSLSFSIFSFFDLVWEETHVPFRILFLGYGAVILASTSISALVWPDAPYNEKGELPEPSGQAPALCTSRGLLPGLPTRKARSGSSSSPPSERTPLTSGTTSSSSSSPATPPSPVVYDHAGVIVGQHEIGLHKAPLSSYLRPNPHGKLTRNHSFVLSALAIDSGDYSKIEKISIKDQPFYRQVVSGPYVRLTLFFVVCSFWANFYIGTVGIQLKDGLLFSPSLTRAFTLISSLGILGMPAVGFLLDNLGFAFTATITVILGICYTFFTLLHSSEQVVYCSFVCYSLFRSFLFTYFFAALPKKVGTKYFGILAGLTFFISGLVQLSLYDYLISLASGTCHVNEVHGDPSSRSACDGGNWTSLYYAQLASLLFVLILPSIDTFLETKQLKALEGMLGHPNPTATRLPDRVKRGGPRLEVIRSSPVRKVRGDVNDAKNDEQPSLIV